MKFLLGVVAGAAVGLVIGARRNELRALARRRRVDTLTRDELYEQARAAEIPGRSNMTKEELRDAVEASQPSLGAEIIETVAGRGPADES